MTHKPDNTNHNAPDTLECDCAETLVAYIYGELQAEAHCSFEDHLTACAQCRDEAAAFGDVRSSVAEWQQSAPPIPASLVQGFLTNARAPKTSIVNDAIYPSKSIHSRSAQRALAAWREFFAVSPRWLQASGATAALTLCLLALAGIAGIGTGSRDITPNNATISSAEERNAALPPPQASGVALNEAGIEQLVNERVQARLAALLAHQSTPSSVAIVENAAITPPSTSDMRRRAARRVERRREIKASPDKPNREGDLTAVAADGDEDDLPRLTDLLGGV